MVVVARPAFNFTCLLGSAFFVWFVGRAFHATRVPLGRTASVFSVDVQLDSIQQKSKGCLGVLQRKKAALSFPSGLTSPLSFQTRKSFSFLSLATEKWSGFTSLLVGLSKVMKFTTCLLTLVVSLDTVRLGTNCFMFLSLFLLLIFCGFCVRSLRRIKRNGKRSSGIAHCLEG